MFGLVLFFSVLVLGAPADARADDWGYHCPSTGGATMSIAPGAAGKCVHGKRHAITYVKVWRLNNQSAVHCAGADETHTNDVHVIQYSCGVGSSPNGYRHTDYIANGRYGYPIHKNNATVTLSGFYSRFSFLAGTLAATGSVPLRRFVATRAAGPIAAPLRNAFGVFRRPRTARDELGGALQGPAVEEFYADQTRLVPPQRSKAATNESHVDDSSVWVAAGPQNRVCLLTMSVGSDGPGSQCLSVADTNAGRQVVLTEYAADDTAIAGVVPDGVTSVLLVLKDGSVVDVPVVDNVYRGRFAGSVRTVTFSSAAGAATTFVVDGS
jgi:hypothetical protein